ncbi:hypothetical protein B0H14DRAFT_2630668 [Mycena olivaceomarginata]|nr:hypothetical protein B0H14DRAFT_2630668 [Mycena olivaceomarginata]
MVELGLENTFQDLSIGHEVFFHPRPGFEQKEGSQSWGFYVVTRGRVPGIYTHCAVHKKYIGWSAATSAWDSGRRPHTPPVQLTPPSTPSSKTYGRVRVQPSTPAHARPTDPAPDTASGSAPSTPARSRKALYVCSQGSRTTIYGTHAPREEASSAARQGPADGSFRRVDVTQRISHAFNAATASVLELYNISDFSDSE